MLAGSQIVEVGTLATGAGCVLAASPAAIIRVNRIGPCRFTAFMQACRQSITGRESGPVGYGLSIHFEDSVCHIGIDNYQEGLNVDY